MSRAGPSPCSGGRGVFPTPTCPRRSILRRQKPGRQGWLPAAGRGFREGRLFLTRGQGSAAGPRGFCEKGQPAVISGLKRSWVDTPLAPMMTCSRCLRKCPPRDPGVHHASGVAAAKAPRLAARRRNRKCSRAAASGCGHLVASCVVLCTLLWVGLVLPAMAHVRLHSLAVLPGGHARASLIAPMPLVLSVPGHEWYRAVSTPHHLNVLLRLSRVA